MSRRSDNLIANTPIQAPQQLSLNERQTLLRIAHQAIDAALEGCSFPDIPPVSPLLAELRGVFTTLYQKGKIGGEPELRGCVGYAIAVVPLYRAVAETARAAAFDDLRFPPVTKDEVNGLQVSLSVLSPLVPIHPEAVEVGRHGLIVSQGSRRGLLLPQVPMEFGWDRETFLEQTCRKAGLPTDAWRKSATVEVFTAEVFSDPNPSF